ncbi:hypothetical protein ACX4ZB_04485 [Aerococcus urinae]
MSKIHKNCIIFDMDGLLVNSEIVYHDAWYQSFNDFDIEVPDGLVTSWIGQSARNVHDSLVAICGSDEKAKEVRSYRKPYF